jgi:ADP-ribose pyrophosphatase YjhB (NUDIX family)
MAVMHTHEPHGVVSHDLPSTRKTDYLFRVSLKCLIRNDKGQVLVVKETGRDHWDLPGGGMDHGEDLRSAIAREMTEEVNLSGDFAFTIIAVEEPKHLATHGFWQLRLIFAVDPSSMSFEAGEDGDEIAFLDPHIFKGSTSKTERRILEYTQITSRPVK